MPTKWDLLKQEDELSRRVKEAKKEAKQLETGVLEELMAAHRANQSWKKSWEANERVKELEWQPSEVTVELTTTNQSLEEAQEKELCDSEVAQKLSESNYPLEGALSAIARQ